MKEKSLGIFYFLGVGVFISTLIIFFYVFKPKMAIWIDNKIYDTYLQADQKTEISNNVVIVDIDDESLKKLGQWPWPRYLNALLLETIVNSGAYSVGFDILMSEFDRTSPKYIQENLNKYFGTKVEFKGLPQQFYDNDLLFSSILAQTNSVLGMYFNFGNIDKAEELIIPKPPSVAVLSSKNSKPPTNKLLIAQGLTAPIKSLLESASVGHINITVDSDGVVRKAPLLMGLKTPLKTEIYPNLSLMTLLKAYNTNTVILKTNEEGIESIKIGDITVPLEADGTFFIRYKGGRGIYPYISAVDIIENRHDPKSLEGKVVFVGSSAAGLLDIRVNPFNAYYPGIEVHASIVDNIMTEHFISVPTWTPGLQVILIVFFGIFLAILLSKVPVYLILTFAVGLSVAFWYIGQYLFTQGFFISPLYVFLSIAIQSVLALLIQFIFQSIQKQKIKGAFSRYVSPVVVSQIAASGIDVFKGSQREVTIMFTDIRGFTTLSEKLKPEEIVQMLNEYFTPMTALIKENSGTLDKFIGDAIMAFWNAPLDVENHPYLAIKTAIQMQVELTKLNETLIERYGVEIKMGAGVHTGKVYVGNMGSKELLDYTIIGDNVNLASRLEGLCSKYGLTTVLSEQTISNCKDNYYYLSIDRIKVKGKTEALSVYYPILHEIAELRKEELKEYEIAFALYSKGEFSQAKVIFEKLVQEYPSNDTSKLYSIYQQRCEELQNTPPNDWNGVWEYSTK